MIALQIRPSTAHWLVVTTGGIEVDMTKWLGEAKIASEQFRLIPCLTGDTTVDNINKVGVLFREVCLGKVLKAYLGFG